MARDQQDPELDAEIVADDDGLPIALLVRMALAGLLVAAVVVFVLQNLDSVPVNFLSFSFDAPLIVLLAIAAGAGIVGRWLVRFWLARRRK